MAAKARSMGVPEGVCAVVAAAAAERAQYALAALQLAVDAKPFNHKTFAARCIQETRMQWGVVSRHGFFREGAIFRRWH